MKAQAAAAMAATFLVGCGGGGGGNESPPATAQTDYPVESVVRSVFTNGASFSASGTVSGQQVDVTQRFLPVALPANSTQVTIGVVGSGGVITTASETIVSY